MNMERRDFLKVTAMAVATEAARRLALGDAREAIAAPSVRNAPQASLEPMQGRFPADVKWDKAPCRFCGTGCHVQVGVKGGKVVAIAGDVKADVNKGLLCVKGYHVGL